MFNSNKVRFEKVVLLHLLVFFIGAMTENMYAATALQIDGSGESYITGNTTLKSNARVVDNFYLGASQTSRYISDDNSNYATKFSSHVYVAGAYLGTNPPVTCVPLYKGSSNQTTTSGSATAVPWSHCIVNGTDISPGGRIQVKIVVWGNNDTSGGTTSYNWKNVTDNEWGTWISITSTDETYAEGSWQNVTWDGVKKIETYYYTSNGSVGMCNVSVLYIRPRY